MPAVFGGRVLGLGFWDGSSQSCASQAESCDEEGNGELHDEDLLERRVVSLGRGIGYWWMLMRTEPMGEQTILITL